MDYPEVFFMKKIILTVLLSLSFIIYPSIKKASAVEISAGASTWFCWWDSHVEGDNMNLKPTLLFGPALSARFNESWNLAGVFLYGKFKSKDDGDGSNNSGPDSITRFDSDLSLNYNFNRYVKVFGGGKYMGFNLDENGGSGKHWSAGPGLGMGTTLPLTESLYLLFNLSGTYSWGKHDSHEDNGTKTTVDMNEMGGNTTLSLAYYFASASTSVSLGFRYHYLYIDYSKNNNNTKDGAITFYGPTFSVIYSF